jgi:hypothetical protein
MNQPKNQDQPQDQALPPTYSEIAAKLHEAEEMLRKKHNQALGQCRIYRHSIPYLKTVNTMTDLEVCFTRLMDAHAEAIALNKALAARDKEILK